mmetsp:Transcript_15059/g.17503  ORF Transcript_15059/g.17503 Transcript_15059/m.17503 type:complete len:151 (+) Transcript_15059:2-454(+)
MQFLLMLFHASSWCYRHIHKVHHEFPAPNGLAALYCHPAELYIADFLPLGAGAFCINSSCSTLLLWCFFAVLATMTHHSGYRWPWTISIDHQPNFHDFHHEKFITNYGNLGFLDTIHGTDKLWREHQKELHRVRALKGKKAAELQNQFIE